MRRRIESWSIALRGPAADRRSTGQRQGVRPSAGGGGGGVYAGGVGGGDDWGGVLVTQTSGTVRAEGRVSGDRSLHHARLPPTHNVSGTNSLHPSVRVDFLPRPENLQYQPRGGLRLAERWQVLGCQERFCFRRKGDIGADGSGSKPVCTLGSEQHGSDPIEQRRILKGRAYPDRRQAAECGDNPVRDGLSGIGDRDESPQHLL